MASTFMTVREASGSGLAPEKLLRNWIHEGKCPGIQHGNRFLINTKLLQEMLDEESQPDKPED